MPPPPYISQIQQLLQLRRYREAVDLCKRFLVTNPRDAQLLFFLGVAYFQTENWDGSIAAYSKALAAGNKLPSIFLNRGISYTYMGKHAEALADFKAVLKLERNNLQAHCYAGISLVELGRFGEALGYFDHALEQDPQFPQALYNKARALLKLTRTDEALSLFLKVAEAGPQDPEVIINIGTCYLDLEKPVDALAYFDKAIALKPDYAEALYNQGNALKELRRLDGAAVSYNKAIALRPADAEAHVGRSLLQLLRGNFEDGLIEYEYRKFKIRTKAAEKISGPLWQGHESLAGKTILIHAEQGLGDTIQFSRYVEQLSRMASRVLFAPQPKLNALFRNTYHCELIDLENHAAPEFDFHCPLPSLPMVLKTTAASIPKPVLLNIPDDGRNESWRQKIGTHGFKIGICWQGSTGKIDLGRSFPLSLLDEISRISGVRLISLHRGEGEKQLLELPPGMVVETLDAGFDSGDQAFLDTASVMGMCDLVLTSDTAVAHLAGSLGMPTWLALKFVPDWRWQLDRDDSPWYPSMRLFRQQSPGDWAGVFRNIKIALETLKGTI